MSREPEFKGGLEASTRFVSHVLVAMCRKDDEDCKMRRLQPSAQKLRILTSPCGLGYFSHKVKLRANGAVAAKQFSQFADSQQDCLD